MEAKELRIGNYIADEGKIIKVTGVKLDTHEDNVFSEDEGNMPLCLECFDAIPLTKDWLKRFGFNWSEGLRMDVIKDSITVCEPDDYEDSVYHSIYFYHNGECFGFEVSNEWGENGNVMLPKVKYVHQLQNLYFALTGEELILKTK